MLMYMSGKFKCAFLGNNLAVWGDDFISADSGGSH